MKFRIKREVNMSFFCVCLYGLLNNSPLILHCREENEREILLGSGGETKPSSSRNLKEIVAKYRKSKDASSLAASARNKLVQRQEMLEKISNDTEELEGRSENYASLANGLLKKMEKRKWWQL